MALSALTSRSMKRSDLEKLYGTYDAIGALFAPFNEGKPLTRSAVSQWGNEIPPLREYQLRELVPDIDTKIASIHPKRRRSESVRP